MSETGPKSEASHFAEVLRTAEDSDERRQAAGAIRKAGLRTRESIEKRGTIESPAIPEIDAATLAIIHDAVSDGDPLVRLRAVEVIGDLGGAGSEEVLERPLLESDQHSDWTSLKLAAIQSLGDIGGSRSLRLLSTALQQENEDSIRLAIIAVVEQLAAKGLTSGPDRRLDLPLVRGDLGDADIASAVAGLRDALQEVRSHADPDSMLRLRADECIEFLQRHRVNDKRGVTEPS